LLFNRSPALVRDFVLWPCSYSILRLGSFKSKVLANESNDSDENGNHYFWSMNVCFNGHFLPSDQALFTASNRSFRYGDGVFETMKVWKGRIFLEHYHYERLFLSLRMLQIGSSPDASKLTELIVGLCNRNDCSELARVRLAVFRNGVGEGEFVIEATPLTYAVNEWNEEGLTVDLYPYGRKNADAFSNLKTSNFLPYVLAELFAKEKGIDDAIVLNAFNRLADTSKANIFLVKGKEIFTPALHQGCVSGVMRRFLLEQLKENGYRIHQGEVSEEDLLDADEVFLTNSIYDMRWVKQYKDRVYLSEEAVSIYEKIISPMYH
jgi:branched-chain amino acid aminotransferase